MNYIYRKYWGVMFGLREGISLCQLVSNKNIYNSGKVLECNVPVLYRPFRFHVKKKQEVAYIKNKSHVPIFVDGEVLYKEESRQLPETHTISVGCSSVTLFIFENSNSLVSEKPISSEASLHRGSEMSSRMFVLESQDSRKTFLKRFDKKYLDKRIEYLNELDLMLKMEHCNFLKLLTYSHTDGSLDLEFEYPLGGSLYNHWLNCNKTEEFEVKVILYQVTSALDYLHQHQVTHFNISPHCIWFMDCKQYSRVKISDFEFCVQHSRRRKVTWSNLGAYFRDPNLINKRTTSLKRKYRLKADCWSLGVILYYCLLACNNSFLFLNFKNLSSDDIYEGLDKGDCFGQSEASCDLVKGLTHQRLDHRLTIKRAIDHLWFKDRTMFKVLWEL